MFDYDKLPAPTESGSSPDEEGETLRELGVLSRAMKNLGLGLQLLCYTQVVNGDPEALALARKNSVMLAFEVFLNDCHVLLLDILDEGDWTAWDEFVSKPKEAP